MKNVGTQTHFSPEKKIELISEIENAENQF